MPFENTPFEQLRTLAAKKKRGWGEIALVLLEAEAAGSWRNQADTLSDWVTSVAQALGLGEASVWRYLSSSRYALELHGVWLGQASDEDLADMLNQASPENLELLSKLERVAPGEVFEEMKSQVLLGSIPRAKLRAAWQDFRPALGGRTAQGIGKATPRVDLNDPEQKAAIFRGLVLSALRDVGPQLYNKPLALFALMKEVSFLGVTADAVGVLQQTESSEVEVHVFCVASSGAIPAALKGFRTCADAAWIVAPKGVTLIVPEGVGLIDLDESVATVVAQAACAKPEAVLVEPLLRAALLQATRR